MYRNQENFDPNISTISAIEHTGFNFREDLVDQRTEVEMTTLMNMEPSVEDDRTVQTSYHCPICQDEFWGKEAIKDHLKKYYKYNCDVCGKIYFRARYLKRHRMNAHLESKKLQCPLCNKEFRAVYNLKQHLHLHSDEKTYVCTFEGCNKRFRQRPGLQQHVRLIHKDKIKAKCPYCEEDVLRLAYHIRTAHKDEVEKVKSPEAYL